MTALRIVLSFVLAAATVNVAAHPDEAAGPKGPWSGHAALGFLGTTGNSETTSLNTAGAVNYDAGRWHHTADALAINASQDKQTTAEAYELGWKSDFDLSEFDYLFGLARWRKDKFSGYDQQVTEAIGYGRRLITTAPHILNVEVGAGARQSDLRDGTSLSETILRGALDYTWTFSETAEFRQEIGIESGSDNTFLQSISAIKATLMGNLALVASYTIKNNSDVPAGTEKSDTFTALSLDYAF